MEKILITGHTLTLEELAAVCRDNAPVALAPEAKQRILESRQVVDMLGGRGCRGVWDYHRFWEIQRCDHHPGRVQAAPEKPDCHPRRGSWRPLPPGCGPGHHAPAGQQPGQGLFRHPSGAGGDPGGHAEPGALRRSFPRRAPWAPAATWPPCPTWCCPCWAWARRSMKERSCQGT